MADIDMERYQQQVAARIEQEEESQEPPPPTSGDDEPPIEFIEKCYQANEIGDSLVYNYLHRNKFLCNIVTGRWMYYKGPHWEIDHHNKAKAACEEVAKQYLRLLEPIEEELNKLGDNKENAEERRIKIAQRKKLLERLDRLRSDRGRNSLLNCAVSNAVPLTVHPDVLDQQPWLFPCSNGVIDLRTGEFRDGTPADLLTVSSPTEWRGITAPCPTWEAFLLEVFDNNQEVVDYLQKDLGYTITGLRSERIFNVFYGPHGQNGKGTLIDVLYHVLGELAEPIQTEMLMSQKFGKSAGSASPEVVVMKGKRLIWASETEDRNSFALNKIKLYSGGDPLTGRGIGDKDYTKFLPNHVLFLICNDRPRAKASDSAFWERIKIFLFIFSFVADPDPKKPHQKQRDPDLLKKLTAEASGILAWMVRGCKKWQEDGHLIPPQKIKDDSQDYRNHEDELQDFIDLHAVVDFEDAGTENRCGAKEIYQKFRDWWEENNSTKPISNTIFSDQMQLKGFIKVKSSGNFYQFIRLIVALEP